MKCWSTRCRNDLKFTERANLWQKNGNDLMPLTRNTGASRQHSSALGALRKQNSSPWYTRPSSKSSIKVKQRNFQIKKKAENYTSHTPFLKVLVLHWCQLSLVCHQNSPTVITGKRNWNPGKERGGNKSQKSRKEEFYGKCARSLQNNQIRRRGWRTLGERSSSWGRGQVGDFLDELKYPICEKLHDKHFAQLSEDLRKISDRVIEY